MNSPQPALTGVVVVYHGQCKWTIHRLVNKFGAMIFNPRTPSRGQDQQYINIDINNKHSEKKNKQTIGLK